MKKNALILLLSSLLLTMTACSGLNTQQPEDSIPQRTSSAQSENTLISTETTLPERTSPEQSSVSSSASSHEESKATSTVSTASDTNISDAGTSDVSTASSENELPFNNLSSDIVVSSENTSAVSNVSTPEKSSSAPETPSSAPEQEESSEVSPTEESSEIPYIPGEYTDIYDSFLNIHTTISSINLSWQPQMNAEGYLIQCSEDISFPEDNTIIQQTADCSTTFEGLKQNSTYFIRVCTYRILNGQKVCSDWYQTIKAPLKTIEVIDGITYVDGIMIANKTYALPANYGDGLTDETYQAYTAMVSAAYYQGIYLWMESGFRSYDTQAYTYQSFVDDRGQELADLCSARPGHSEHQTGMAIDVNTTSDAFAYTDEAVWLAAHCAEYGFIIRYPYGKEEITGYKYEPWHVRYVGIDKAAAITASGLTLEEYYGITSVYAN